MNSNSMSMLNLLKHFFFFFVLIFNIYFFLPSILILNNIINNNNGKSIDAPTNRSESKIRIKRGGTGGI